MIGALFCASLMAQLPLGGLSSAPRAIVDRAAGEASADRSGPSGEAVSPFLQVALAD